jgi:hypothetical protein
MCVSVYLFNRPRDAGTTYISIILLYLHQRLALIARYLWTISCFYILAVLLSPID